MAYGIKIFRINGMKNNAETPESDKSELKNHL